MDQATASTDAPRQLIAYSFPPGADFGGLLMGALQRIESGGALRILHALFVGRGIDSEEIVAVSLSSDSAAGMIGQLIGFRLEASARAKETERALEGPDGALVRALADALQPGAAVAGVFVEHAWAQVLAEAVARIGGAQLGSEMVEDASDDDAWARLTHELAARTSAQE
jgi:hypothetical protein